ncbi:uncharacterized protein LOC128987902 [Macrosteles quadrilineatus]|uniref:uncharacterized protein LOC128987902 n=1 Tax=Macrosteles quadrilineatus TaxID=74068 RepID=UPI0023E23AA9|nr:uncharacterized protein LOC128987902 [Macrosteles quadrilineatus]
MNTLIVWVLIGVNIPGLRSQNEMCKDGNAIYYPSQQWAGPPGTCQLHRCTKLIDGIVAISIQRCPEEKLQGVSKTGSCQISGIDRSKMYPQCCPTISCTRVVGGQAPCNRKQINMIDDDYLDLVLN